MRVKVQRLEIWLRPTLLLSPLSLYISKYITCENLIEEMATILSRTYLEINSIDPRRKNIFHHSAWLAGCQEKENSSRTKFDKQLGRKLGSYFVKLSFSLPPANSIYDQQMEFTKEKPTKQSCEGRSVCAVSCSHTWKFYQNTKLANPIAFDAWAVFWSVQWLFHRWVATFWGSEFKHIL